MNKVWYQLYTFLVVLSLHQIGAVWNKFDFVRSRPGAWGSDQQTSYLKFNSSISGGNFGYSVANIGDIDSNGVDDIAVGAIGESMYYDDGSVAFKSGGLYILLMNSTGGLLNTTHINSQENGGPLLVSGDQFGFSLCALGDLDGDSVPDIAIGAPGVILSGVYVLFMNSNATVRNHVLIRGNYEGSLTPTNDTTNSTSNTTPTVTLSATNGSDNAPPIRYGSRFGTSLANIGDFNGDGVVDIAVGAIGASAGVGYVYLCFMSPSGSVLNYTTIGDGIGGGPIIGSFFGSFGSSVVVVGDLDHNNVSDLAIGARNLGDQSSLNPRAGVVFVCLMHANGTAKQVSRISEFAELARGTDYIIPMVPDDNCGSSLASIGDINMDDRRQHQPTKLANPVRRSIPDLVIGCPQTSGTLPGRLLLTFLTEAGSMNTFRAIPADSDEGVGPPLKTLDQFGSGVAGYWDVDGNGLTELLVGAPGDDEGGSSAGAIYIVFLRRRRYHGPVFNYVRFFLIVTLIPAFCCGMMIFGVMYFLWYFRRLPDEVEIIVKNSGLEINPHKKRARYLKKENQVYAEEYTL